MRRTDREVTDPQKIRSIITKCHCCRLGFCDEGRAYIVPMNFGYEEQNGNAVLYFHSAKEGRKIDLIRKDPQVTFELDTGYELVTGMRACDYTARFESVMCSGKIEFIEDDGEKAAALTALMAHNTGSADWDFPPAMLNATCVLKLTVAELTCKVHL